MTRFIKRLHLTLFAFFLIVSSSIFAAENKSKTLVVYYSLHGTTQKVAEEIQKESSGEIFRLQITNPYTGNDRAVSNRAKEERESKKLPSLVLPLPDLAQYDVIFVGGPVWSSTLATPVMTFLAQNDFSGKTVIPFWTDFGIPGDYEKDFNAQTTKGTVLKGLGLSKVSTISNSALRKQIKDWISSLKIK